MSLNFQHPIVSESTGKVPEAISATGNLRAYGLFDECLSIRASWTNTSFQGQYCTVFFQSELVTPGELDDTYKSDQEFDGLQSLRRLLFGPKLKMPKVRNTNPASKHLMGADFCIPSSCSVEDFRSSVAQLVGSRASGNTTVDGIFYYKSVVTIADDKYCYTKEKTATTPQFNGADISFM